MVSIVVAIHVVICIVLCIVVLLQQGKGAEVGAVFGGSSTTNFGTTGQGNALTKTTWVCAVIFFCTSLFLAYASTHRINESIFGGVPIRSSMPITGHVTPRIPAAPAAPAGGAPLAPAPGSNPASSPNK
ncbi:MAG: preprotein translocase subunit SecG [Candidatus Binataceae bacterium]